MDKFELNPDEQIIRDEKAGYLKSKLALHDGRLIVTTQRVVFCRRPRWATAGFGLLGALLVKANRVAISVAAPSIVGTEPTSFGRNKNVLALRTNENEFRFVLRSPYAEWDQLIGQTRRATA